MERQDVSTRTLVPMCFRRMLMELLSLRTFGSSDPYSRSNTGLMSSNPQNGKSPPHFSLIVFLFQFRLK